MSLLALLALVSAFEPAAAVTPPQAAPVAAVNVKQKEKKICHKEEGFTGSRMNRTVCHTETEWAGQDSGVSEADLKTMGAH